MFRSADLKFIYKGQPRGPRVKCYYAYCDINARAGVIAAECGHRHTATEPWFVSISAAVSGARIGAPSRSRQRRNAA